MAQTFLRKWEPICCTCSQMSLGSPMFGTGRTAAALAGLFSGGLEPVVYAAWAVRAKRARQVMAITPWGVW
ncbi:MAG: hypothetical protein IM671_08820 [Phenylobacterium sp.]|uniref:hypothetical protein n=1 Tax=Phenylobacterium sp. TaxID=1871053 RepID=UPI0025EBF02A|nr:hypothetical protein [Phenylobacterium sp.]MCA6246809.1 hypothetical protein [Phenylobacterium sp.]MCA6254029.1 hypothetical protein [Phenylobacterium sp.]